VDIENLKTKLQNENFVIDTIKSKLQLDVIHGFLSRSYWSKNIPKNIVEKSIKYSFCFGVYHLKKQVGFARLITDYCTFAYLADVFILEGFYSKLVFYLDAVKCDYLNPVGAGLFFRFFEI